MPRAALTFAVVLALHGHLARAGEDVPPPSLTIRPVSLRLTHDFRKPVKDSRAQGQQQAMQVWMGGMGGMGMDNTRAAGCSVGLEILVDDAWALVSVGEPSHFQAELDSGETVAAPPVDKQMGGGVVIVRQQHDQRDRLRGQMHQASEPIGEFLVRCAAPQQPATVIRRLTGTVEVTMVAKDAIKRIEVPMTPGVSAPVPIPGCDIILGQNDQGQITLDYAPGAGAWIDHIAYLDADGNECRQSGNGMGNRVDNGVIRNTLQFTFARPVATVAIDAYAALRVFAVDFAVMDLPFVGAPHHDVLEPRRLVALRELSAVVPPADAAPPADDATTPPGF